MMRPEGWVAARAACEARSACALGSTLPHAGLVVLLASLFLAPVGSGCRRKVQADLTLAGSTSVQPFAEAWADAYVAEHPRLTVHVQGGGSTAGIQAAVSGAAQIGLASRALTLDEASRATSVVVARDGIAVIVHAGSTVADLTLDEVRGIYSGEMASWGAVGGRPSPVTLITREEGSGTRAAFEALVMRGRRIAAGALVQDSTGAVRQMVASDPAAIGYVALGIVDGSVKAVRIGGVTPSEAAIDAGTYPLVRPFLLVLAGRPPTAAKEFVVWMMGPAGRALVRHDGLLPPRT